MGCRIVSALREQQLPCDIRFSHIVSVLGVVSDPHMAGRVRLVIEGRDGGKRENALEVLAEGLGDPRISRALWAMLIREETRTDLPRTANSTELQSQNQ